MHRPHLSLLPGALVSPHTAKTRAGRNRAFLEQYEAATSCASAGTLHLPLRSASCRALWVIPSVLTRHVAGTLHCPQAVRSGDLSSSLRICADASVTTLRCGISVCCSSHCAPNTQVRLLAAGTASARYLREHQGLRWAAVLGALAWRARAAPARLADICMGLQVQGSTLGSRC
jgi:hypothetical protein